MKITVSLAARSTSKSGDEISRLVGLAPDECKEKGSTTRAGQTPTVETVWKLQAGTSDSDAFERTVDTLCARIEPHMKKIKSVEAVTFDLDCVIRMEGGERAPDLGLSARAVGLLADLRAEVGISFY